MLINMCVFHMLYNNPAMIGCNMLLIFDILNIE